MLNVEESRTSMEQSFLLNSLKIQVVWKQIARPGDWLALCDGFLCLVTRYSFQGEFLFNRITFSITSRN